ncbi:L-threonylcarbamoyladenylate synthase [Celeribacter arenosi]|uniref:L-threonylcarbamoyladenylate synthase n=1 Tax=Celeribacter arenosi TaxID=792649 RepID=A0ABP7JSS8_9RHOB
MTPDVVVAALKAGKVVLLATDTVLGLAVSPAHEDAVERLYALKDRPREKNLPVMVADLDQIVAIGGIMTPSATALATSEFMPGPLTIVLGLDPARTPAWLKGRSEIAVRIPDDDFLRAVLRDAGPLFVTSANRSGRPTPATSAAAAADLTDAPDLVVTGTSRTETPSTLVNCQTVPPKIERLGAVSRAQITQILGDVT